MSDQDIVYCEGCRKHKIVEQGDYFRKICTVHDKPIQECKGESCEDWEDES